MLDVKNALRSSGAILRAITGTAKVQRRAGRGGGEIGRFEQPET